MILNICDHFQFAERFLIEINENMIILWCGLIVIMFELDIEHYCHIQSFVEKIQKKKKTKKRFIVRQF